MTTAEYLYLTLNPDSLVSYDDLPADLKPPYEQMASELQALEPKEEVA